MGSSDVGYLSSLKSGGANSLTKNATNAVSIIKKAVGQVAMAQGRVGGFQKFQIKTSINALQATKQSLRTPRATSSNVDYAQAPPR